MNIQDNTQFKDFITEIKSKILSSQYEALKAVNKELIGLYWDIGKNILEKQEAFGWGKSIVKNLSEELQKEFVGMKGFSERNLWNMRNFYIKSVMKFGWTYRVLDNHIDNNSYERYLLNQTNFDTTLPDEYNFDFLELSDKHSEYQLELGLINKVREFLAQMGSDFTFVGNQYKLEVDGEEYFIDLLLYHRRLKSLIAVELKIGKFKPEYAGKMSFYLSVLNDTVKLADENPSIGIIICKEKKRTTVEYALKESNQPIGIATYKVSENLPENLKQYLPTSSEIERKLLEFLEGNEKND